jgi:hypothetical protein
MFVFPTLDGNETWEEDCDLSHLKDAEEALAKLRKALNKIHRSERNSKSLICGLTCGIEAYLNMLSMGKAK